MDVGDTEGKELGQLVDRYKLAGSEEEANGAVGELLSRIGARIRGVVRAVVGDPQIHDEIVVAIYERIARGLRAFRGECPVINWCLRIAYNTSHTLGAQLTPGLGVPVAPEEMARLIEQDSIAAHEEKERGANQDQLLAAVLDKLTPACRELLRRRFFEEMLHEQISIELDKSVDAVTKAVGRCLEAARRLYLKTLSAHA